MCESHTQIVHSLLYIYVVEMYVCVEGRLFSVLLLTTDSVIGVSNKKHLDAGRSQPKYIARPTVRNPLFFVLFDWRSVMCRQPKKKTKPKPRATDHASENVGWRVYDRL